MGRSESVKQEKKTKSLNASLAPYDEQVLEVQRLRRRQHLLQRSNLPEAEKQELIAESERLLADAIDKIERLDDAAAVPARKVRQAPVCYVRTSEEIRTARYLGKLDDVVIDPEAIDRDELVAILAAAITARDKQREREKAEDREEEQRTFARKKEVAIKRQGPPPLRRPDPMPPVRPPDPLPPLTEVIDDDVADIFDAVAEGGFEVAVPHPSWPDVVGYLEHLLLILGYMIIQILMLILIGSLLQAMFD